MPKKISRNMSSIVTSFGLHFYFFESSEKLLKHSWHPVEAVQVLQPRVQMVQSSLRAKLKKPSLHFVHSVVFEQMSQLLGQAKQGEEKPIPSLRKKPDMQLLQLSAFLLQEIQPELHCSQVIPDDKT